MDADSVADLRALVLSACLASAQLSPEPPVIVHSALIVHPAARTSRADSRDFQAALMWGLAYLLGADEPGIEAGKYNLPRPLRIETQDGAEPSPPTDTGVFPWIAVVAIVTATTALAGVLALWLTQKNEIAIAKLATDERVQKHAATLAELSSVIEAHVEHEKATGQTLPWDPQEVSYLDSMKASIATLSATPEPTLKSAPDLGSISKATAGAIGNVGEGAKNAVTGAGVGAGVVVAAVVAYLLLSNSEKPRRERAREAA